MKNISALLQLEENCRNAENIKALKYIIVNETRQLLDFNHAVLLSNESSSKLKVQTLSDIATLDQNSSFVQWIHKTAQEIRKSGNNTSFHHSTRDNEFTAPYLQWIPLTKFQRNTNIQFYLLLFNDRHYSENEKEILQHLSSSYSHFLYALNKVKVSTWFFKKIFSTSFKLILLVGLIFLMFLPVQLSVLAPFEVKARNPLYVTSPLNGVIKNINVTTNQKIQKGDILFTLNDIQHQNHYVLAKRTLEITKAKLKTIEQNSFVDPQLKSQIATIRAESQLKKSEMEFAKYQYNLTKIYANKSGTVLINDTSEWLGKPVLLGEKVLLIANKDEIEIEIMLPVSDAIFLDKHAKVKIFFDNDPLETYHGEISKIYYEPLLTPQNILSYKLIANFEHKEVKEIPQIGLRGTAKIYSQEVTLFFYLFKKPITSLRQWIGW